VNFLRIYHGCGEAGGRGLKQAGERLARERGTEMEHPSIGARLDALERQARTYKRLLLAAIAAVIVLASTSSTTAQQHEQTFTNAKGEKVSINSEGLFFYNSAGTPELALYISDKGQPVIRMRDAAGKDRAYFGLTADTHNPRIQFNDPSENQRLYVGITTQNTGQVSTFNTAGTKQTSIDDDQIRIGDASGNNRIYLGITDTADPILRMYAADGTERLYAGIYTDGKSGFSSYSTTGSAQWSSP